MIDIRGLNIVSDGVPFCRVDLTGESYGLNIVSDGVPWIGWSPDETPAGEVSAFPGTVANDASSGTIEWSDVNNIKADDGVNATVIIGMLYIEYGAQLVVNGVNTGSKYTNTLDDTLRAGIYGGNTNLWDCSLTPAKVNASNFGVGYQCAGMGGTSYVLRATNFGFNIPNHARIDGVTVTIERQVTGSGPYINNVDYIKMNVYYTPNVSGYIEPGTSIAEALSLQPTIAGKAAMTAIVMQALAGALTPDMFKAVLVEAISSTANAASFADIIKGGASTTLIEALASAFALPPNVFQAIIVEAIESTAIAGALASTITGRAGLTAVEAKAIAEALPSILIQHLVGAVTATATSLANIPEVTGTARVNILIGAIAEAMMNVAGTVTSKTVWLEVATAIAEALVFDASTITSFPQGQMKITRLFTPDTPRRAAIKNFGQVVAPAVDMDARSAFTNPKNTSLADGVYVISPKLTPTGHDGTITVSNGNIVKITTAT